jgi:EAL domain-containing protein (putative c-di-GMP-specific phosphodiesterase class I)
VLQLDVVAEGVETEAQADVARQAGCHVLQGALYASPLTADEAQARLTRSERGPEPRPEPNPQFSQRLA